MKTNSATWTILLAALLWMAPGHANGADAPAGAGDGRDGIYPVGHLKPVDSKVRVRVGEKAPDFVLPSVAGEPVRLSDYRGRKMVSHGGESDGIVCQVTLIPEERIGLVVLMNRHETEAFKPLAHTILGDAYQQLGELDQAVAESLEPSEREEAS